MFPFANRDLQGLLNDSERESMQPIQARVAAVRMPVPKSRGGRWSLCQESLIDDERQYDVSKLTPTSPLPTLVRLARSCCAIEVQYRDLGTELWLDHFEGRSAGWNHHAVSGASSNSQYHRDAYTAEAAEHAEDLNPIYSRRCSARFALRPLDP